MRSTYPLSAATLMQISLAILFNVLTSIKAMFAKLSGLKGIALGPAPRLPIKMADDEENYKDKFKYVITAIIILLAGVKTISNVTNIALYILGVFNTTAVKILASYNFVTPIALTIGSIFEILVVVLIIMALLFVIRYLMRATDSF